MVFGINIPKAGRRIYKEQIIGEVEAVRSRAQGPELIREIGVREATIYIWKSKTAA